MKLEYKKVLLKHLFDGTIDISEYRLIMKNGFPRSINFDDQVEPNPVLDELYGRLGQNITAITFNK